MRLMDPQLVKRIVEAALLAAGQPLAPAQLAALFSDAEPVGSEAIAQALQDLQAECGGRGVELVEVASGFRYQVRQDVHPWVARMWTERQTRYSRALLETLALIAYRQPITRAEIEQIRGVVVSSSIIRTLEERDWVRVVGHRDVPGRPALLGTTRQFLDHFNLKSLDELPPLAAIRDLEDFDPQLPLPEAEHALPPLHGTERGAASEPATDEDADVGAAMTAPAARTAATVAAAEPVPVATGADATLPTGSTA